MESYEWWNEEEVLEGNVGRGKRTSSLLSQFRDGGVDFVRKMSARTDSTCLLSRLGRSDLDWRIIGQVTELESFRSN